MIFLECAAACIVAYAAILILFRIGAAIARTWRGY